MFAAACAFACASHGEEGLWTFDNFPAPALKQSYGVEINAGWLDHLRLSTVRLTNCTASFVSPNGLILTNHHCIESCLAEASTKDKDLVELGVIALNRRDEARCLAQQADVLMAMEDVTPAMLKATVNLSEADANKARKKMLTALEESCEKSGLHWSSGRLKCQVVKLYQGGQYYLYKYKRYEDLRVVFAPEADIASFGGDPDNFQFPRWSLDFALLRAYENDLPARTPQYLRMNSAGPKAGDLVLVAGHPGSTARLQTSAQLEFERGVVLPVALMRASELRGRYMQFGKNNPADDRLMQAPLNSLQNLIKVRRFELDALNDPKLLLSKRDQELELRNRARLSGSDPWADIETALAQERTLYLPYILVENGGGFSSVLVRDARWLVRGADERAKPNASRLREFTDGALPGVEKDLLAPIPTLPQVEQMTLSFSLERMRDLLGPDHPVVRKLLSHESPDELATRLIAETKLDDVTLRRRLWQGGRSAVMASHDPLIEFVRSIDPDARAIRKQYEDEVEARLTAAAARIATARFAAYGTHTYPDATFTLRLNYGTVEGWVENGTPVEPFTYLQRAFDRATGATPFKIPDSWVRAKARLDPATPFCISTSNDIVGGNSGSALVNSSGELVGLMFDGNAHSVAGRYWLDPEQNRAVALHPAIIKEALQQVYGAKALWSEMAGEEEAALSHALHSAGQQGPISAR
jgi:Peptidase S46